MPDIFISPEQNNQTIEKIPDLPKTADSHGHVRRGHSLSAFAVYPKGVKFETQEDKEEIILLLRRHIITNLMWVFIALIMLLLPLFFPFLVSKLPFVFPVNYQFFIVILWYSLIVSSVFMNFLTWYFNVYIVTNERIVDVDFYNLTFKKISSARLNKIQDVTIRAGGVIRTIFDFATVYIQTAGTEVNFEFEDVPHPDDVARQVMELSENYKSHTHEDHL